MKSWKQLSKSDSMERGKNTILASMWSYSVSLRRSRSIRDKELRLNGMRKVIDLCTKFFFNWVKGRRGKNFIYYLKREPGDWVYDNKEIGDTFRTHFFDLCNPIGGHETLDVFI
ncbi:hypothetical protein RND81_04G010200 [Saponaria officinalis]|uniref:Uncharacterized protein n=1 Tax=Saponaria officinalis TaxID=3572 RepID=A0AAW1LGS1_SAPOF